MQFSKRVDKLESKAPGSVPVGPIIVRFVRPDGESSTSMALALFPGTEVPRERQQPTETLAEFTSRAEEIQANGLENKGFRVTAKRYHDTVLKKVAGDD